MSVKYVLESGLMERRDLRSGRIYQEGLPPEYGVIFTSNESKTEDDLGLDPNLMLGALIGVKKYPENETARFFEILGGYFYHDNYPDPGTTTKVFGIALQPEFGVTEGGTTTLDNNWNLDDPEKPILDESYWSGRIGKHHGWTFIVTLKERKEYPTSDEKVKIFVHCPEIKEISVKIGDCVYDADSNQLKRHVTFKSSLSELKSENWIWHFGDGSTESGEGTPPDSIDHLYKNKPESAPKLCLGSHTACDEICEEVSLSEFDTFVSCPECPEIIDINVTFGDCVTEDDVRRRKVTFEVSIEGDEPDSWTFHFGDGSTKTDSGNPPATIEHYYEKRPHDIPRLCIVGPEPCGEVCKEVDLSAFEECPPCPKITRIDYVLTDKDAHTKTAKFTAVISGNPPEKFEWDWGDGSPKETTTESTATHDYELLASGSAEYVVTVTSEGPEDCRDSAETTVKLPPKVECPEITDINVTFGDCVTEDDIRRRQVTFEVSIEGDEPDSWTFHFGDGSTKTDSGSPPATIEHYYEKKPQVAPKLCIVGPDPCGETCKEVDLSAFEECPPCPKITDLKYESIERDESSQTFRYTAEVSQGKPDKYEWDYGDGSKKEETTEPTATHTYAIPDKKTTYTVTVTSHGPGDCQDSSKEKVTVKPPHIVPRCCILLPLLVAFLMATTFGTFVVYCAAKIFDHAINYGWLVLVILILAFLTIIAIVLWYQIARRILCPPPSKCDWLAIRWVTSLAGTLVAFYVRNCCEGWWWAIIIILLLIAGLLFYNWIKKCAVKLMEIVLYLIACLLAAAFVCYLIAYRLLERCLR